MVRFVSGVLAVGLAASASGTIITFDPATNGGAVPTDIGSRVIAEMQGGVTYGSAFGFTPNVVADIQAAAPRLWTTTYGDLQNVLYDEANGAGLLSITLTADPGWFVVLHGFDMAGWRDSDYTINSVRVVADGDAIIDESNVLIRSASTDGNGNRHTSFDPGTPITGQQIVISFDAQNLGGNSDNIGIDNIAFGQTPIPAPAGLTAFAGLAMLARSRR